MADDIGLGHLGLYPPTPHHLMGKEGILGDAHRIGDATRAVVRLSAMVGIGVGEDNLHTTRRDARACAWALQPVVVPAAHHLNGKLIHVVIIVLGRLAHLDSIPSPTWDASQTC